MSEEGKINLFVRNDEAYIWTSDDWIRMRSYRVIGSFIGNLAALPRQVYREGFPLLLLPEEATLLVEKGFALMKHVPSLSEMPSSEVGEKCQFYRNEVLSQQVELLKELRKKEIKQNIDKIVEGKIKKLKMSSNQEFQPTDPEVDKQKILQQEFDRIQTPKTSMLSVQLFKSDPWIEHRQILDFDWSYPKTDREKLRYRVYANLWDRGYYITAGHKFGADYLVYPGDPVKFHSFFIVLCVDGVKDLKPNEIITYGRLGQSVRKTFVLAYLSEGQEVHYHSIQWMGR